MRRLSVPIVAVVLASTPLFAGSSKNVIRFGLGYVSPSGETTVPVHDEAGPPDFPFGTLVTDYAFRFEGDPALAVEIEYERLVTSRLGFAFAYSASKHDLDASIRGSGTYYPDFGPPESGTATGRLKNEIRVASMTGSVRFHFPRKRGVDLWLGPLVAQVDYGDLKTTGGEITETYSSLDVIRTFLPASLPVKSEFTYGAEAGVDRAFGRKGWGFGAAFRYLRTQAEIDAPGGEGLEMNPWSVRAGFSRRF